MRLLTGFPREPFPGDEAREEAERELSRDIYQRHEPSLISQALDWLERTVADLLSRTTGSSTGSRIGALIIVVLLIALIAAALLRFGPLARSRRSAVEAAHLEPTRTEAEHRRLADAFAAEGRYAEAVRERLRAIVRSLTDRGLLDDRPGRTATEIAEEAGRELPSVAGDLLDATDLFGAVWYGRRTATADDDALLRAVDAKVAAARPGQGDGAPVTARAGWAAPQATVTREQP